MPSFYQAEHIMFKNNEKQNVTFPLISLPLYMVEESGRIINEIRMR